MFLATYATWIALGLILALIGLMQIGWRIGKSFKDEATKQANVGAIQGAIFALLGLLIAFTFANGMKVAWAKGATTRIGGNLNTIALGWQYAWFK